MQELFLNSPRPPLNIKRGGFRSKSLSLGAADLPGGNMLRAHQQLAHLPHTEKIQCAFCRGSGKDPFGQLYPGSTCQVCNGRKIIFILTPYKTCAYCHGSGVAFSSQNTCTVCNGRGVISLKGKGPKKGKSCSICGGTGMEISTNLPCTKCRGTGSMAYVS